MIYQIIYRSKLSDEMSFKLLVDILESSEFMNRSLGITGFLLATDTQFLQVLEGSFESVNHIYHRIVKDERHKEVQIISYNLVADRAFPEWGMKAVSISNMHQPLREMLYSRFGTNGKFEIPTNPNECYSILRETSKFVKNMKL